MMGRRTVLNFAGALVLCMAAAVSAAAQPVNLWTEAEWARRYLDETTVQELGAWAESRGIDSSFTSSDPSRDCRRNLDILDV